MYRKNSSGWVKHVDFILLDLLCIQLAFYFSYVCRMGEWNPYSVPIYRNMAIFIELADIAVIFLFESYKNVLKRGYYIELVSSIKQAVMLRYWWEACICSAYRKEICIPELRFI